MAALVLLLTGPALASSERVAGTAYSGGATQICVKDSSNNCNPPNLDASGNLKVLDQSQFTPSGATAFRAAVVGQAASLLEIMPATAGRAYVVTKVLGGSNTGTASSFALQTGTGSNCGSSTTQLFPLPPATTSARYVLPINTAQPLTWDLSPIGIVATTAHALCVIGLATNTANVTVLGYYYTP